ncbi:GNAT family N-acetyltransferase [Granulicoccus sp. GXG6511]|uniref:GNAT family N-acetyltransferase n=1 Tax=Granulicoccus sp. GXG6511 TaxID=3381351 RepID=UPI003D7DCC7E
MRQGPQDDWTIRPVTAADGLIGSLGRAGFLLAAETADGTPLGMARVLESDGLYHLLDVSVLPGRRRGGIGTALVAAVESEVVERGASALTLAAPTPEDVRFFARLRFTEVPRLPVALRSSAWDPGGTGTSTSPHRLVAMGKSLAPDVTPRPAVSVIPLRDGADGLEVFAQHRVATMDFAAGAVVFPGGRVDEEDYATTLKPPTDHQEAWAQTFLPSANALVAAAIREVAEECGVVLDPVALVPWDNWVTPPGGRRRFDVAFFVTAVGAADSERWGNTTTEAVRSVWEPVAGLLAAETTGTIRLMTPTKALLTELAEFATSTDVLAHSPLITAVLNDESPRPRPPGRPSADR